MKNIFSKVILVVLGLLSLVVAAYLVLWLFLAETVLSPEKQTELKAGKSFWTWASSRGPLQIHYVEKGEGDKHVFLIHGFRSHSYTWKELIDPLANAGYHVWVLDLVGFGLSDKPIEPIYKVDFFVEQINAFAKGHGIENAHFIGNSMGGGLALAMALQHPEKVRSLILVSALGYPLDLPPYLSIGQKLGPFFAPFLGKTLVKHGLEQIIYNKETITEEQVEAYSFPYRLSGGAAASFLTLNEFDNDLLKMMSGHYPQLKFPVLLIWGEGDTLIPLSHYNCFVRDFPHAEKLLIPQCGHVPQEEEAQMILPVILTFLLNH